MKVFDRIVVMRWDEFTELLKKIPRDEWIPILDQAGIYDKKVKNKLLTKTDDEILSKIYTEMEEML